jgi:folate-dependent phosphoribosylglycinamide formyltransferase PurN
VTVHVGWFTTARGSGSRSMYDAVTSAIADGSLDARIAFVFSNRGRGEDPVTDEFFAQIDADGIPLIAMSSVAYRKAADGERSKPGAPLPAWRVAYDQEVAEAIAHHRFDVGVLAGYMLIFTAPFVERFPLLNLHPALPTGPIGTWREVNRQLIRESASESGVMMNLAIPAVDEGPVVGYCRYSIAGPEFDAARAELDDGTIGDDARLEASRLFQLIREAGVRREAPFLVELLRAFAGGRVRVEDGSVTYASGRAALPIDLTVEVDERLLEPAAGQADGEPLG